MKLLLTVSFLGTNYCGFQAQPSGRSVQQTLNRACDECFAAACTVTGCSRTDAGVHANRYMAVLGLPEEANRIPRERIPQALNRFLPDDIAVREARPVGEEFHPRYTPHTKEYVYLIHNSRTRDPFLTGRAWQYPRPLDEKLMDGEAQAFVGRHDFAAFMAAGSDIEDTVRTVLSFRVTREDELIRIGRRFSLQSGAHHGRHAGRGLGREDRAGRAAVRPAVAGPEPGGHDAAGLRSVSESRRLCGAGISGTLKTIGEELPDDKQSGHLQNGQAVPL